MSNRQRRDGPMRQPPGRAQRRGGGERKPREERWSELIEVATDVFYAKGYDAASLQDIADRLGMLKGSLYYYIQSKEDLLFDVIKAVHEEGLANIESLAAGEGNPLERLRDVIIGHIEHECRNLTKTAVFLHELQALSPARQVPAHRQGGSRGTTAGRRRDHRRRHDDRVLGDRGRGRVDPVAVATVHRVGARRANHRAGDRRTPRRRSRRDIGDSRGCGGRNPRP